MIKNYKIYFPKGIIHCKNYKEKICLHLLEHLIIHSLSKKLNLQIPKDIKGGVVFDYVWFRLFFEEKNILQVQNYLQNIKKNIHKSLFFIEEKRIFEELLWRKYNLLDPIGKIEEIIFPKIFNLTEPPFSYRSKILKTISFKDIISFIDKFFDYSEMLILEFSDNEYKIIKKPEKSIKFDNNVLYYQKENFFKLKSKKLPSASVFAFSFSPDPKTILFINFLGKYLNSLIKEKIIFQGLAYSHFYKLYYFFLDKITILILIPSSKSKIVFNKFNKLLKSKNLFSSENFMNFKEDTSKIIKTKFFKYFEPYIIYSIFKNENSDSLQKFIKEIKNLDIKDFKNIFQKDKKIYKFLIN